MKHRIIDRVAPLLCALVTFVCGSSAWAQLTPQRLYNGINRPVQVRVDVPPGLEGDVSVALLAPVTAEVISQAPVEPGEADLAAVFPALWTDAPPKLRYAQLLVGTTKVGPALVLQPMLSPSYASGLRSNGVPDFRAQGDTFSGLRIYVDRSVVFETSLGRMVFRLRPDQAPNTAFNFRHLADSGYYTGIIFHRIIGERSGSPAFVVQVGDPTGTGTGGPGYYIDLEPSKLEHDFGVLSMARAGDPNTNGGQVFIALSRAGTARLDGNYTAFAEAIEGADTILALSKVPVGAQDRPNDPPVLLSARLIDADPYGDGPAALVQPAAGGGER